MTITASLKRRTPTVNVKVNTNDRIESTTPVTIQQSIPTNRLDRLQDVVASGEIDGATLVYDASQDKYIVKRIDLSDIGGNLDGGTF